MTKPNEARAIIGVAAIMPLILMGIFGTGFAAAVTPIIALTSFGFVIYIFGSSLHLWNGPYDAFSWWSPEITELMIVLLIFGLIIWFITREPTSTTGADSLKKVWSGISSMFEQKK